MVFGWDGPRPMPLTSAFGCCAKGTHHREPGPNRLSALVEHQEVEWRMVGLPDLVWRARLVPVQQVEYILVRFRAFLGQEYETGVQLPHDSVDTALAWH